MSIGLDIGSQTIKIIELSGDKNKYLKSAGAVSLSSEIDIANLKDEKTMANLAQAIKKLASDAKIGGKQVAVSIPESKVFTRILKFPLLTDQEIASAVKWEAEEYIPIPIEEAVIEHQIIERRETSSPPQVLVLLIAAPKVLVENYIKIVELAGFDVEAAENSLMALSRSLSFPDKTAVIVDIGASSSDIAISQKGQLYFSRSVPTAGSAFSRAVAQSLGVSPDQAQQYKKTYGLNQKQLEGKVYQSLSPIVGALGEEVKKSMHYHQNENRGEAPSILILAGGSAAMPGITSLFARYTGLEVSIANPFAKINVDQKSATNLSKFAPLYAVAAGLALRD